MKRKFERYYQKLATLNSTISRFEFSSQLLTTYFVRSDWLHELYLSLCYIPICKHLYNQAFYTDKINFLLLGTYLPI